MPFSGSVLLVIQHEIATRVKPWWWKSPTGKVVVAVRYGAARIELAKGKNAIEVGSMGDLVAALEAVKRASQDTASFSS